MALPVVDGITFAVRLRTPEVQVPPEDDRVLLVPDGAGGGAASLLPAEAQEDREHGGAGRGHEGGGKVVRSVLQKLYLNSFILTLCNCG